jgi:hypothetical protein
MTHPCFSKTNCFGSPHDIGTIPWSFFGIDAVLSDKWLNSSGFGFRTWSGGREIRAAIAWFEARTEQLLPLDRFQGRSRRNSTGSLKESLEDRANVVKECQLFYLPFLPSRRRYRGC